MGVGRGYEAADRQAAARPAGALALDAAYSPITRVSYNVEMSRLGKITDYEKLVVEVWTNGAVSPDDALTRAVHLPAATTSRRSRPAPATRTTRRTAASGEAFLRDALGKTLEELPLPARAINALKGADIHLVADLVQKTEADLGAGEEPGREVHRRDQDRARRPRARRSACASIPNVLGRWPRRAAMTAEGARTSR